MNPKVMTQIGDMIRSILESEYGDVKLQKQCKRASILFDMACQKLGYETEIKAGYINREGDSFHRERGHIWNTFYWNKQEWILDITLTQFDGYLGKTIPNIICTPKEEAVLEYGYVEDGMGEYVYEKEDVRFLLIQRTLEKLKGI